MAFESKLSTEIYSEDTTTEVDSNHILSSEKILLVDSETQITDSRKPNYNRVITTKSPVHRTITDLPPALISEIFNCLDPKELGVVSCVNPSLYQIASDHHVWKQFYCERWGLPAAGGTATSRPVAEFSGEKSWKELFVEREFHSKTFMGHYNVEILYGHTETVRTVFLLPSRKLIFTSGYDSVVRMWDMEDGICISASRPLGCTIRALSADSKLLVAGGSDGFIHGWRAEEGHPRLFDINGSQDQDRNRNQNRNRNQEFRLWEHQGPITCLSLDLMRIYSGSWDMTIRIYDRVSLKCLTVLMHNDWVWALVPHDTTVVSTAGSDSYIWETNSGSLIDVFKDTHVGNAYSLARSHTGSFVFTGGEDGAIHMFEVITDRVKSWRPIATWNPHSAPVHSLSFEFPWLVSGSGDGKLSLIDVRKLLKGIRAMKPNRNRKALSVEPPQRMLNGLGKSVFSVSIGADRIVCGGEEGSVRIWDFSRALEREKRAAALRGLRAENRMRRQKLQKEIESKGGRVDQCLIAAKSQMNGERNGVWYNKRGLKVKG